MRRWPLLIIVVTFILCLSCGGPGGKLSSRDKLVDIVILEDRRNPAGGALIDYLTDPDPEVRSRAALALGRIGHPAAVDPLGNLLGDSVEAVRLEAAFAIGQIGDTNGMFPIAANLAYEKSVEVKCAMIEALGKIGHPDVASTLVGHASHPDPAVRGSVALALSHPAGHGMTSGLIQLSRDTVADVRWKAVYAMSRTADSAALGRLYWCLKDSVPVVRLFAARAIGALNDSSGLRHLTDRLRYESDDFVKVYLLRSIARVGDRQVLKSLLNILSDEHPNFVKAEAITAMGELRLDKALARLKPFLAEEDRMLRRSAMAAIALANPEFFMEHLAEFQEQADCLVKLQILRGLSHVGTNRAFEVAVELLSDEDPGVRRTALETISGFENNDVRGHLEKGINDPDYTVNIAAVEAAASRGDPALIQPIAALYHRNRADSPPELRLAVVTAFSNLTDSTSTNPAILAVFNKALGDADYRVRQTAIHAFARMGVDRSSHSGLFETTIAPGNYKDIFNRYSRNPIAVIRTNRGDIEIELLYDIAPMTVTNFIRLAKSGFYDGRIWHRVIPGFIVQDGCPRGDGWGGPGYTIRCEYNRKPFESGTLGMAHSGKDTGGSQFFITQTASPHLDGKYTAFGKVISGMRAVNGIEVGDSIRTVEIRLGNDGQAE